VRGTLDQHKAPTQGGHTFWQRATESWGPRRWGRQPRGWGGGNVDRRGCETRIDAASTGPVDPDAPPCRRSWWSREASGTPLVGWSARAWLHSRAPGVPGVRRPDLHL